MDEYPDLSHLADEAPLPATAPPTAATLETIVARARRGRARAIVATVAAAALVGSAAGFLVARNTGPSETRVAAASTPKATASTTTIPTFPTIPNLPGFDASSIVSQALSGFTLPSFTSMFLGQASRVFERTTADGIRVRAYAPGKASAFSAFGVSIGLVGEVSDTHAVGMTMAFAADQSAPAQVHVDAADVEGQSENSPMWTATLATAANVAKVVAHFADGSTDEMAPVQGWAILAHHVAANFKATTPLGTVQAFDAAGHLLGTFSLGGSSCTCHQTQQSQQRHLGDMMKPVTTTTP